MEPFDFTGSLRLILSFVLGTNTLVIWPIQRRFMEPARMLTGGPLRAAPHLVLLVSALLRGSLSLPPRPPVLASPTALCRG
jgi:hypothetical protein